MDKLAITIPGPNGNPTEFKGIAGMPTGGLLTNFLPNIITVLFVLASISALFLVIYGGIKWITSGGSKDGVESARKTIIFALAGLAVIFLSYFIVNLVGQAIGVEILCGSHRSIGGIFTCVP